MDQFKTEIILGVKVDTGDAAQEVDNLKKKIGDVNNTPVDEPFKSLKLQIREATVEVQKMAEQFGRNSTQFKAAAQKAANLKDEFQEINEAVAAFNPDNKLQGLVLLAKGATGALQGVSGAMAFLGIEGEKATQTMAKLQGLMAFSNALNSVDDIKNAFKNFGSVISSNTVVVNANTAATAIAKTVMAAFGVEAEVAATSFKVLRIAILGLGIAALVAGIYFIVTAFKNMSDEAERAALKQNTLNEVSKEAAAGYGAEKAKLDALVATMQSEHSSRKLKLEALEAAKKLAPGYFDSIKNEKDIVDKLGDAYKRASEGILAKANAEAASKLLGDVQTKKFEKELELQDKVNKANKLFDEQMNGYTTGEKTKAFYDQIKNSRKAAIQSISADYDDEVKDLNVKSKVLLDKVVESNQEIDKLGGKVTTSDKPKAAKDTTNELKAERDKLKAHLEELQRITDDALKTAVDAKVNAREKELNDIDFHYKDETNKIKKLEEEEKTSLKEALKKKLITQADYNDSVAKLTSKGSEAEKAILEEKNQKKLEVEKKYNKIIADFIDSFQDNAYQKSREKLIADFDEKIKVADEKQKVLLEKLKGEQVQKLDDTHTAEINVKKTSTNVINTEVKDAAVDGEDEYNPEEAKRKIQELNEAKLNQENADYELKKIQLAGQHDELENLEATHNQKIVALTKDTADKQKKIDQAALDAKISMYGSVGNALTDLSGMFEKHTTASKALAITGIIVDEAAAVAKIVTNTAVANAKAVAASPLTAGQPWVTINSVMAGASIATGIAASVKAISQIGASGGPSGGGGGSIGSAPSITAPSINSTVFTDNNQIKDVRVVNQQDQVVKAYVNQRDLQSAEDKSNFINKLSSF